MKNVYGWMAAGLLAASGVLAMAQDTRESAVAGMRKPDAKEMDATYNKKADFAQKLVDDALAKHPEVILLAIHAGAPKYWIVASNFGRLGKLADEDDMRCIRTGKANLEVNTAGNHFEDELPLRDRSGKIVGAVATVFNYKPGDDKAAMARIATEIQKEMSEKIKSNKTLFEPAS